MRRCLSPLALALLVVFPTAAQPDVARPVAWPVGETERALDATLELRFAPDLSALGPGERVAVDRLLEAGRLFQELYEDQLHPDAAAARDRLPDASPEATLYRLFGGPVGTTEANERAAFLDVRPEAPGKNVYPEGVTREELSAYLERHPEDGDALLGLRTVVRRATAEHLARDRAALAANPGLALLHPDFHARLDALTPAADAFYAVPYAVAFAPRILRIRTLLLEAADAVQTEDPDFAAYLRLRATDLLTGNYEGGDAAWVSGQFRHLNAQIGSYETYDDALFGVKAFESLSLLARDDARSDALATAITDLQALEDRLPYERRKRVRSQVPVGVYNVIADFGQARGTNTATILPNEADHARKYGRTILLRYNVLADPQLYALSRTRFCAAVAEAHCGDLTIDGNFERTLWHEVGHYLGVDETDDGRALGPALSPYGDLFEELKADLVSLHSAPALRASGYLSDEELRSVYASGVLRVLQSGPPRHDQPYQTMQLMQWNYFLDRGLLTLADDGRLRIDYDRYAEAVEAMLREVLAVQAAGDAAKAAAFVDRWASWDEGIHGRVAERVRAAPGASHRLVRYAALGE